MQEYKFINLLIVRYPYPISNNGTEYVPEEQICIKIRNTNISSINHGAFSAIHL